LLFLKGDKYTDPIDGKSFKSMLPYGYEKQQCASPSTLSLERHRFVFYLNEQTDFFTAPKKCCTLHQSKLLQTVSQSKLRLHHYRFVFALT
jgi:hypothetical protein